ncbi:MAG: Metallophosphoesterase [Candidatus Tokpelaia sp. JSC188]|nr:MAG: Metallophosphoesterase [Candidatus Tokpelaia sp. JSC188]
MRFLFLGDMVGRTGRDAVFKKLPDLIADLQLDFVVVNGENAANGHGITERIYLEALISGIDVVTSGNHIFDQKDTLVYADRADNLLRPANFPKGTPGKGSGIYIARNGARVLVANVMGRVFMYPDLDAPFGAAERIVSSCPLGEQVDAVIFDFHAEATSEKQCFGHFLDSRVSVVVGTHTHVPTADAQILEGGTAYMSDAGMCGDYDSTLGMDKEEPLQRFLSKIPRFRYEAANGPATICGLAVDISDRTGLAEKVSPLRIGPRLQPVLPEFW